MKLRLLFEAEPFCYGPSSIAIAIADEFHRFRTLNENIEIELVAIGNGTSYELFSTCKLFDKVIHDNIFLDKNKFSKKIIHFCYEFDYVITIADFNFAQATYKLNNNIIFVDPLYWMWEKDPIPTFICKQYYVTNFPGILEKCENHRTKYPDKKSPKIINQICIKVDEHLSTNEKGGDLLVNFGGIESPFGSNLDLVKALSKIIIEVADDFDNIKKIHVCGGKNPIRKISSEIIFDKKHYLIKNKSQPEFIKCLSECKYFMTVPGLSIIYEAICLKKTVLILPPLNYSQHLQLKKYKENLIGASYLTWDELPSYSILPENLPEKEGVQRAFKIGSKFSTDKFAQELFKHKIKDYLSINGNEPLVFKNSQTEFAKNFNGSEQILNDIFRLKFGQYGNKK